MVAMEEPQYKELDCFHAKTEHSIGLNAASFEHEIALNITIAGRSKEQKKTNSCGNQS